MPWVLFALVTVAATAQELDSKKLRIFILAGQSNMVGHANCITIPRLFTDEDSQVRELAQLVFKPDATVTRQTVDALIAARISRDALANRLWAATPGVWRLSRHVEPYVILDSPGIAMQNGRPGVAARLVNSGCRDGSLTGV